MARIFLISLSVLFLLVFGNYSYVQAQIQDCPLNIIKSADPADDTEFEFELGGNSVEPPFTLQDPSNQMKSIVVPSETAGVFIVENVPPGWAVTDIQCDGDPGFNFIITDPNRVVASCEVIGNAPPSGECVFTNELSTSAVPAMSQWGMLLFAGIIGLLSFIFYRRRLTAS